MAASAGRHDERRYGAGLVEPQTPPLDTAARSPRKHAASSRRPGAERPGPRARRVECRADLRISEDLRSRPQQGSHPDPEPAGGSGPVTTIRESRHRTTDPAPECLPRCQHPQAHTIPAPRRAARPPPERVAGPPPPHGWPARRRPTGGRPAAAPRVAGPPPPHGWPARRRPTGGRPAAAPRVAGPRPPHGWPARGRPTGGRSSGRGSPPLAAGVRAGQDKAKSPGSPQKGEQRDARDVAPTGFEPALPP